MPSIENAKHRKYVIELASVPTIDNKNGSPRVAAFVEKNLNGANFSPGYSYLSRPLLTEGDTCQHEFDQVIFSPGGTADNITDFDTEIEFTIKGQKKQSIVPPMSILPRERRTASSPVRPFLPQLQAAL